MEKRRKLRGDDPKFSQPRKRPGRKVHVRGEVWRWGVGWIVGPDGKKHRWYEHWMEDRNSAITPFDAVNYIQHVILKVRPSMETLKACPPRLDFEP